MAIDTGGHGHEIKPGSDRSFGLVFAAFFALVGSYGLFHGNTAGWIWLGAGGLFAGIGLAAPALLAPLNRLWFQLGMLLARVVQPIAVGIVFFLVVTPIGLLMRALGKDLLNLKRDSAAPSYWIERSPPGPAPETMKRQF